MRKANFAMLTPAGKGLATIVTALFLTVPVGAQDSPNAVDTQQQALEHEVVDIQHRLAVSEAECRRLRSENAALMAKLNPSRDDASSVTPLNAVSTDTSTNVIALPAVRWNPDRPAPPQLLLKGQTSKLLSLAFAEPSLTADANGAGKLNLTLHKKSAGFGTESTENVGKLWIFGGTLYLQWAAGDQSFAANALRFAVLRVGPDEHGETAAYNFTSTQAVSLPLQAGTDAKVDAVPAEVAARTRLQVADRLPDKWQNQPGSTDQTIQLKQDDVEVTFTLEPKDSTLHVDGAQIDPAGAQRHLDAVHVSQQKTENELSDLLYQQEQPVKTTEAHSIGGGLIAPAQTEDRSWLTAAIKDKKDQIKQLDKSEQDCESAMATVQARAAALAALNGLSIQMVLPNGVIPAQWIVQASSVEVPHQPTRSKRHRVTGQ